jgi:hypothetical protein
MQYVLIKIGGGSMTFYGPFEFEDATEHARLFNERASDSGWVMSVAPIHEKPW